MVATRADAELRRQIEQALRGDLRLNAEKVAVEVSQGAVRLTGVVPNRFQKQEALAVARQVAGRPVVADDLRLEPGHPVPDHEVKYHVEDALVRDERLRDKLVQKKVSTEVRDGVVLLTGMVDSPAERHLVEEDVWGIPGVAGIDDRMAVGPVPSRSDKAIAQDVVQTLQANPWIDSSKIKVAVRDQVVELSGSVPTREQKRLAEDAAWWVPGVYEVRDSLAVGA